MRNDREGDVRNGTTTVLFVPFPTPPFATTSTN